MNHAFKRIETADTGWPTGPVQVMAFALGALVVGVLIASFVIVVFSLDLP